MGQKEVKPPPVPEKTLKEMVKEMTKVVMKERRQFQRQLFRIEQNDKKLRNDLEKMTKNRQPMANRRIIAQNIMRTQRFAQKYRKLDLQLESMQYQLSTMASSETLVNVMRNMAQIMGKANAATKVGSLEQALVMFQTEAQKGNMMGQMIEDAMNMGDDMIEDQAADKLIAQMQLQHGKMTTTVQQPKNMQYGSSIDSIQTRLQRLG